MWRILRQATSIPKRSRVFSLTLSSPFNFPFRRVFSSASNLDKEPTSSSPSGKPALRGRKFSSSPSPISTPPNPPRLSLLSRLLNRKQTLRSPSVQIEESINGRKRHYFCSENGQLVPKWDDSRENTFSGLWHTARAVFLPVGYPQSVHPSYLSHHFWLMIETLIGSIQFVLFNQAMLDCLGLGDSAEAAGIAVAIQWVLKDGLGEIGKLVFTKYFAKEFDSKPKTWKFIGECLSSLGSGLMILTAFMPPHMFLYFASVGNAFRAVSFLIWGSTTGYFSRNFAKQQNVGDIMAKLESQAVVAHLIGMGLGIGLIAISHTPTFLMAAYGVTVPFQVIATLRSINAVQFEVLNESNTMMMAQRFLVDRQVPTPHELRSQEKWFGEWPRFSDVLPRVSLGDELSVAFADEKQLEAALTVLKEENYLLALRRDRTISAVLHENAQARDVLKALFHSVIVSKALASIQGPVSPQQFEDILWQTHPATKGDFAAFVAELEEIGWNSSSIAWVDHGARARWDQGNSDSNGQQPKTRSEPEPAS